MKTRTELGVVLALIAYVGWGASPVFWKQLAMFTPEDLLALRAIGSAIFIFSILAVTGSLRQVFPAKSPIKHGIWMLGSALLIGCNWWLFIWAVNHGRILETSFAYFLSPLLSIALGVVVFRERLSPRQVAAVAFAASGVVLAGVGQGRFPIVALAIAFTFSAYGAIRKWSPMTALGGLQLETAILSVPACWYLYAVSDASFEMRWGPAEIALGFPALMLACALMTTFPLACFAGAAKRLRLSDLGIFQYIAPTITFATAIGVYGEPVAPIRVASFALVWVGIAIYITGRRRS